MRRAEILALQSSVDTALSRINHACRASDGARQAAWVKSFYEGPQALPEAVALFAAVTDIADHSAAHASLSAMLTGSGGFGYAPRPAKVAHWVSTHPAPESQGGISTRNLSAWTVVEIALGTSKMKWAALQSPILNLIVDLDSATTRAEVEKALTAFHSAVLS